MNKEALLKILKTRYFEFTSEEIIDIMNDELNKDPDEMDLELVDLCLDALDGKFDYLKHEQSNNCDFGKETHKGFTRKISFRKIISLVAVISVIICTVVFMNVHSGSIELIKSKVTVENNFYNVELYNSCKEIIPDDTVNDVEKVLSKNGVEAPALPQILFEEGVELTDTISKVYDDNRGEIQIDFFYEYENATIRLFIEYDNNKTIVANNKHHHITANYKNVKEYLVDEIYVLTFLDKNRGYILYRNNDITYKITVENMSHSFFKEIVNSVG